MNPRIAPTSRSICAHVFIVRGNGAFTLLLPLLTRNGSPESTDSAVQQFQQLQTNYTRKWQPLVAWRRLCLETAPNARRWHFRQLQRWTRTPQCFPCYGQPYTHSIPE
ncbi:GM19372 [Drosophila sechellia]|uniref:GM19372 n=1 Tax=Drosophila sechellia TaxID=7238 RepID=B4HH56_DROSE|nr:GM19372 [Drosophila sechellia]